MNEAYNPLSKIRVDIECPIFNSQDANTSYTARNFSLTKSLAYVLNTAGFSTVESSEIFYRTNTDIQKYPKRLITKIISTWIPAGEWLKLEKVVSKWTTNMNVEDKRALNLVIKQSNSECKSYFMTYGIPIFVNGSPYFIIGKNIISEENNNEDTSLFHDD